MRRQNNEPSPSSLPAPFTVDPPSSAAFQDHSALDNIQISRPRPTISLKKTSSSIFQSRLAELPRAPPSTQTKSGPSSDLETRVKQLEEEITKARDSRETIASIYRSQFAFLYNKIRALDMAVHQNESPLGPRSTGPREYVDYHLRTLREDIFSKAYHRTITYPDELQPLPTQPNVQQN